MPFSAVPDVLHRCFSKFPDIPHPSHLLPVRCFAHPHTPHSGQDRSALYRSRRSFVFWHCPHRSPAHRQSFSAPHRLLHRKTTADCCTHQRIRCGDCRPATNCGLFRKTGRISVRFHPAAHLPNRRWFHKGCTAILRCCHS